MPSSGKYKGDKRAEWLREKAIQRLQDQAFSAGSNSPFSAEGIEELVEELRIHQAELEQQAEEINASQAALEASRDAYYALFDLAPIPQIVLSSHGAIVAGNRAAAHALGLDRTLLKKRSGYLLFDETGTSAFHDAFERALQGQDAPPFEAPVVRADGSTFPGRVHVSPFQGHIEEGACMMILMDTTPLAAADAPVSHALSDVEVDAHPDNALRAHCLDLLVDELPISAWTTDRRLTITYCEGSLLSKWGRSGASIEGKSIVQAVEGMPGAEAVAAMHRKALDAHENVTFCMDWRESQLEVRLAPIQDSEGRIRGLAGVAIDLKTVDNGERAAVQGQRVLASLLDSMADATALCDAGLKVRYANQALLERISMPWAAVVGRQLDEVLSARPDLAALWRSRAERALATGEPRIYQDSKLLMKAGQFAETTVFPVRGSSGEIDGVGTVIRDVTERRRHERELQEAMAAAEQNRLLLEEANEELQAANQHKNRFMASLSHELRTPLNAIMGFADLLLREAKGPLTEGQRGYVEQCRRSGEHLLALITDLLDIARIDTGRLSLDLQHCSPEDFVEGAVHMLREKAHRRGIEIEVSIQEARLPLYCDARRCRQVVINILSNALKFSPEGGRVVITIQCKQEDRVEIRIRDWGPGIAPGEQTRIFSEFYQVEKSHRDQAGGAGIGLALSRRLVELHGGEIGVESTEGEGSTFWFALPLDTKPPKAFATQDMFAPGGEEEVLPTMRRRVLVAEDNEINLMLITEFLKEAGHQIIVARNGQEAIDLAHDSSPDIILMDLHMPVVDGTEAMRRIYEAQGVNTPPMIALSASVDPASVQASIEAGAVAHLAKPFTPQELFDAMERGLDPHTKG